ncbi:MAG: hypothetical protein QME96_09285 [Myxococcota bacterium]|nr:hypothetical protein [Myxococcota bacterium]
MKNKVVASLAVVLALSASGCIIEVTAVGPGDPCTPSDRWDQHCTTSTTALYCSGTTWVARNCDAECRTYGYTGGSCAYGTYRDECLCSGVVYTNWRPSASCSPDYDSYCWNRTTMYYCHGGTIHPYDCWEFCRTYYPGTTILDAFCMFDPVRSWDGGATLYPDDNCYCNI